jgi:predicted Zn-dependent protease
MKSKNLFKYGAIILTFTAGICFAFDFPNPFGGIPGGGGGGGDGDGATDLAKGVAGISLQEELDKGGSLACEIAAKNGGLVKDAALTKRIAIIGKALAIYSTRPELPWVFGVLDSDDINGVSAPGGYVFISKGLIKSCKNDSQIASVLAHEIAHVTQRHALKVIAGKQGTSGAAKVALGFAPVNLYGADGALSKTFSSIVTGGLPKGDEYDADKVGTQLAYDTGFPPRTLRDFLESLKGQEEDHAFSHHPKIEDRVDRLDDQLKEMGK